MRVKMLIIVAAFTFGLAVPGIAVQRGGRAPSGKTDGADVNVNVTIGSNEQRIIREWFAQPTNLEGLPPGLAKKDRLPPGLQRQLVRNGQLPPGLQKQVQPLPYALEARLPRLPEGRSRVIIGGTVVLLQNRSTVLDVFAAF